jgi:hypothetical protein
LRATALNVSVGLGGSVERIRCALVNPQPACANALDHFRRTPVQFWGISRVAEHRTSG